MSGPCYIFDIDGTLSDPRHRLHLIKAAPKDWRQFFASCKDDPPIDHVCDLARRLDETGMPIICVSGRSDEVWLDTSRWLNIHGVPAAALYMRAAGDYRPDDVVKLELLERIRRDGWRPVMAFDDRDRVVAAWRRAGIPCAQVAPGNF